MKDNRVEILIFVLGGICLVLAVITVVSVVFRLW
jgi:hypothetical protein